MADLNVIEPQDIQIVTGTNPIPDNTNLASVQFTQTDKIRFYDGAPETVGGCDVVTFDGDKIVEGVSRAMYSQNVASKEYLMISTHKKLYTLLNGELTNMTPAVAAASATTLGSNPFATDFVTLGTDPFAMVDGSTSVTVARTGHPYQEGDSVTLAGASGTINGVPDTELNAQHIVRTVPDANSFTITVTTAANADASGGGASITCASQIIRVTDATHGMEDCERTILAGAAGTAGGVDTATLNAEWTIRYINASTYDIYAATIATSSASGGGASVTRREEIADGQSTSLAGRGYGMGRYGVGLYGVSKTSSTIVAIPRIWSFDRFGNLVVMTEGDQGGVYEWDGTATTAPVAVTNAPTDVDYVFTSDNILVTLGQGGVGNRLKWSDQGDRTDWTAASANQAGEDDIEGANNFISHINVNNVNLLYCEDQLWTMRYIGRPTIWKVKRVQGGQGIIAPQARCQMNGVAFWMGNDDFYYWNGSAALPIRGNGKNGLNPLKRYIFDTEKGVLNREQKYKCFAWANTLFNEVWFHFPTNSEAEPDAYAILNLSDFSWTLGTWSRTAAEYPRKALEFPRLIDGDGILYRHEKGLNDGNSALNPVLRTNLRRAGNAKSTVKLHGVIPDTIQQGDITLKVYTRRAPNASPSLQFTRTITATTEQSDFQIEDRYWEYEISQGALDASMRLGLFQELLSLGAPN